MNYRISLLVGLAFIILICAFKWKYYTKRTKENEPPNILFVIIDDLGFYDLSGYGSKIYETSNIDQLARESFTFHNAYANYPRCLPSRYSLLTATYPVQEFNGDLSATVKGDNFIKEFKKAGYESFYVGKWHQEGEGNSPKQFGFDDSFAANSAGGVASHFYPFNTRKLIAPIGEVPPIKDVENESKEGDYLVDVLTDKMIDFVVNHDKSKPFFGILSTYAVHTPLEAKQKDIDRNKQQISNFDFGNAPEYVKEGNGVTKMRQDNPVYAAMVENMDWNIGRLMKVLEDKGLKQNTIVVFTSDHGGLSNKGTFDRKLATSNYPLRAGKGHLYEGGIRVPLFIRWPGKISPGEDKKSIVALMDLMPTLLDLSINVQLSNVDGQSFEDVLLDGKVWDKRTIFFHEKMARPRMTGDYPCTSMRSGKYKLLHFFEDDIFELYDLSADISEQNNLIDKKPEVASKMIAQMNEWKASHLTSNESTLKY